MARDINLPDPKTFTRAELAERWKCDISLIDRYINDGQLKEGFSVYGADYDYLWNFKYFLCKDPDHLDELTEIMDTKTWSEIKSSNLSEKFIDTLPAFLYLSFGDMSKIEAEKTAKPKFLKSARKKFFSEGGDDKVCLFCDLEWNPLAIIAVIDDKCEKCFVKRPKLEDLIIPLEEILRFEKEHGIGENEQDLPAIDRQEKIPKKEQEDADKLSQRTSYGNKPPPAKKIPLTKKEVATRLGISVSHLVNVRKFEDFPKPFPLIRGGKKLGWDEDELEEWIAKERGGENRLTNLKTQTKEKADPEKSNE